MRVLIDDDTTGTFLVGHGDHPYCPSIGDMVTITTIEENGVPFEATGELTNILEDW